MLGWTARLWRKVALPRLSTQTPVVSLDLFDMCVPGHNKIGAVAKGLLQVP